LTYFKIIESEGCCVQVWVICLISDEKMKVEYFIMRGAINSWL